MNILLNILHPHTEYNTVVISASDLLVRVILCVCVCVCRPNVCVRTTESFETRDNNDDDDDDVRRRHHHFAMSTVCDDSDTVYKCTVK